MYGEVDCILAVG